MHPCLSSFSSLPPACLPEPLSARKLDIVTYAWWTDALHGTLVLSLPVSPALLGWINFTLDSHLQHRVTHTQTVYVTAAHNSSLLAAGFLLCCGMNCFNKRDEHSLACLSVCLASVILKQQRHIRLSYTRERNRRKRGREGKEITNRTGNLFACQPFVQCLRVSLSLFLFITALHCKC